MNESHAIRWDWVDWKPKLYLNNLPASDTYLMGTALGNSSTTLNPLQLIFPEIVLY